MSKFSVYECVTKRIIEELENGNIPWTKTWQGTSGAWDRRKGKYYGIINQWLLPEGEYATFKQINAEGGRVNEGAKAKQVFQWFREEVIEEDNDGNEKKKYRWCFKYTNVFNIDEDTNLERKWRKEDLKRYDVEPIDLLEAVKNDYVKRANGLVVKESEFEDAYYVPSEHRVCVPCKSRFKDIVEFYSTLFHELGHSTGHSSLLARDFGTMTMLGATEDYSKEELVAELVACSVLANCNIETDFSFKNSTAYIQSWIKALKGDSKLIVQASSKAESAYKLIMGDLA